jgi:elongation factor P
MKATEIRKGQVLELEGQLFVVHEFQHVTPGNWRAMVQTRLRNVTSGSIVEKRFRSTDEVTPVFVERKKMEYLYSDGREHVFMDMDTFDQIPLPDSQVEDILPYLRPNTEVQLVTCNGRAIQVEAPRTVDLEVKETPPPMKGATVTNQYKEAVLETGLRVQVPPFIVSGEVIRIDTQTGEYVERAG